MYNHNHHQYSHNHEYSHNHNHEYNQPEEAFTPPLPRRNTQRSVITSVDVIRVGMEIRIVNYSLEVNQSY
ncbi:B3 domain-containing protein IDEF1-like [Homalodisca vitripennis]|uniref:B3 domain-containing protein IDEF1-like n=1 Tax=Homalodisca vitripennis TaxID=197043 RepID=UPI001EEAE40E|nr:B3 domain-containing protein IDEF1-like [Homalodisca vitripennis]